MTEEWLYPSRADFHCSLKEVRDVMKLCQQKGKGGHGQQGSSNSGTLLGCGKAHWKPHLQQGNFNKPWKKRASKSQSQQ